jgi:hypothetical protein
VGALADPAARSAWSAAGRTSVEAFGADGTAARSLAEYERLLVSRPAPARGA